MSRLVAQARNGQGVKPLTLQEALYGVEYTSVKRLTARCIQYTRKSGERVIRLHLTDIITFHVDGSITIDTGGSDSPTTRQNINRFLEEPRIKVRRVDYVHALVIGKRKIPFLRYIRFYKNEEKGIQVWSRDGVVPKL